MHAVARVNNHDKRSCVTQRNETSLQVRFRHEGAFLREPVA